jgi:hypothetical protein
LTAQAELAQARDGNKKPVAARQKYIDFLLGIGNIRETFGIFSTLCKDFRYNVYDYMALFAISELYSTFTIKQFV